MDQTAIRENLQRVRQRIEAAARKTGRHPEEITLIAVSKTHPGEAIQAAYGAGLRDFGENRVQEWEGKVVAVRNLSSAKFHLIGHLQSNKAARAAKIFDAIDSVDDLALAQRLDRARRELNSPTKMRVLLEVHIAGEETKSGAAIKDVPALARELSTLPALEFAGLMCIPPFSENAEAARPYFSRLRELRDSLASQLGRSLPVLSMGMSHDFEVAIEEGATEVRVGTAIFGARGAVR